jgi:sulfide dehydrogenase cytochrome subunit
MVIRPILVLALSATMLTPVSAQSLVSDPAPPGASSCGGCHAPRGIDTAVPPLHGRSADDIVRLMAAFRSGAQPATVMDRIAKGFSETETEAIAAWYARQK